MNWYELYNGCTFLPSEVCSRIQTHTFNRVTLGSIVRIVSYHTFPILHHVGLYYFSTIPNQLNQHELQLVVHIIISALIYLGTHGFGAL